jgi:glycosyltransferase involved in cell wall biosynthesis
MYACNDVDAEKITTMKFAIFTHVVHGKSKTNYFAYSPYVNEMNIWLHQVDEVIIVAPLSKNKQTPIDLTYSHDTIDFKSVPEFHIKNSKSVFKTLVSLPKILFVIYNAMKRADHIHLRCPGNIGLLGCFVQILFPAKPKTAKYAGNWDLSSKQPLSYRFQKWILSNTFLTKNMQVLVYGDWENSTKNIKSFFTASYFEKDKFEIKPRDIDGEISFLFVGTLSVGKQPLYAIKLIESLNKKGYNVDLTLFGEGSERTMLENYISENKLENFIFLKGNQNQETIKKAYCKSHFVILPSLSEGWPKAIAEGMFWGCMPIASAVSCISTMLDAGKRGILLHLDFNDDLILIENILNDDSAYKQKVENAINWSRNYTLDVFEDEIKQLLQS